METICNNASQFIGKTLIFAIKDFPPNSAWERTFDFNNTPQGGQDAYLFGTRNRGGGNELQICLSTGGSNGGEAAGNNIRTSTMTTTQTNLRNHIANS